MEKYKSPYRRGADSGAWFGLYLTALFMATVMSMRSAMASLLGMVLMAGVVPVVYTTLRRAYLADSRTTTLSSLWMQGIMMFMCGSSISGAVAAAYMKWINPTYLYQVVTQSIEAYASTGDPSLEQVADGLQLMLDAGALPSAISLVFASIWAAVLSGSILSLLAGIAVRVIHSPARARSKMKINQQD